MYDVWKMDYSGGSSKLMDLAMSVTSHQFIESLTSEKIIGDIAFQVGAQIASIIAGKLTIAAFAGAGSSAGPAGTAVGFVVGMLTYWLINSLYAIEQEKEMNNYLASQATYNENYQGVQTLSSKWWKDAYFGDTMTHTLQGTSGGVYSEIKAESGNYTYEGQVILAPPGEEKTTNFGTQINRPVLDYSQQTRGFVAYSDFEDQRVQDFFYKIEVVPGDQSKTGEKQEISVPRDDDVNSRIKFMRNTIMYLEDHINTATEHDVTHYDSIIPYMMSIKPTLQFANSENVVVPEFFLTHPIYVDHEEYESQKLYDEYYRIYKMYDSESNGVVQLVPEEYVASRPLMSDIIGIDVWIVDNEGNELGPYKNYLNLDEFTFDPESGQVNFTTDTLDNLLETQIEGGKDDYNTPSYNAQLILEFHIEKYRDITVARDDITPEEAQRIATMQSAHQSILEYTYQFSIAESTQQRLSEICYTAFITITSTIMVIGASYGFSKVIATPSSSAAQLGAKAAETTAKTAFTIFKSALKSGSSAMIKVATQVLTETLEELYVDPMIEAYVSNKVADIGLDSTWQIILSGLAESGRESFAGIIGQTISASVQSQVDSQISQNIETASNDMTTKLELIQQQAQSLQDAQNKRSKAWGFMKEGLSTILMFTGALSGGLGGTIGTTLGNMLIIGGVSAEGIKDLKDAFKVGLKKKNNYIPTTKISDYERHELSLKMEKVSSLITNLQDNQKPKLFEQTVADIIHIFSSTGTYAGKRVYLEEVGDTGAVNPEVLGDINRKALIYGQELDLIENTILQVAAMIQGWGNMRLGKKPPKTSSINLRPDTKEHSKKAFQKMTDFIGQTTLDSADWDSKKYEFYYPEHRGITFEEYDQVFLKKIWKKGIYKGDYVFGMIYKWTNTKSGEFGYDVDMSKVGRTEQRIGTNRFPPVSGISRRFGSYLRSAIRPQSIDYLDEGTIEYDMRAVYDEAGGSLAGEKAIINTFKLEIVEIMFISESYSRDKRVIEQLEDFYINRFGTRVPMGYNIASGATGAHVAEEKGGHGMREFVRVLDHLISHGFEFSKLADYFGMSEAKLRDRIKTTHGGEGFSELQAKFIGEKIRELVSVGLILPSDLEPYFKDLDCDEVFLHMKRVDNGELLRGIIMTLISMGIAHIDSGHKYRYVKYEPLAEYMGLSKTSSLKKFIQKEIDLALFDLDLDLYLRPLAWYMIESSTDALDLLESIGWGLSENMKASRRWQFEVNQRIHKLFGMTYERAKIQSTNSFIGDFI